MQLADPLGAVLDSRPYLAPILTPYEGALALTGRALPLGEPYPLGLGCLTEGWGGGAGALREAAAAAAGEGGGAGGGGAGGARTRVPGMAGQAGGLQARGARAAWQRSLAVLAADGGRALARTRTCTHAHIHTRCCTRADAHEAAGALVTGGRSSQALAHAAHAGGAHVARAAPRTAAEYLQLVRSFKGLEAPVAGKGAAAGAGAQGAAALMALH